MPVLLQRVRRFVRTHDLMRPDTRVVCALSGGSDSVALAHLLAAFAASGDAAFVGLVHLNHRLRPTADRDERFCRALADRLARPLLVERADVAGRARREGRSVEDAAHAARYELYERARARFSADVVALGHTQDDQAETFLLRLLRGAGPRGLAAMYPRNGAVVRPLLECRRAELREWLAVTQDGPSFVEDETNADVTVPRNRVRETLLPLLARDFNPNIVEVLAREADLSREVWAWLEGELATFGADLEVDRLKRSPLALRRLALWRAMTAAADGHAVSLEHVSAALTLLDARDGASLDAPGHRVQRKGGRIVLMNRGSEGSRGSQGARGSGSSGGSTGLGGSTQKATNPVNALNPMNPVNPVNLFCYPLSIPGEVVDQQRGFTVSVAPLDASGSAERADPGNRLTAAIRRDLVGSALAVRNRRPGDRFRPVGVNGSKKLQDYFVDRKIAREARDSVPIVVDDRDRIVWVAGHGIDEAFRVTDGSQGVLILKFKAVGGSA